MSARHLGMVLDWRGAVCGAVLTEEDKLPTTNEDAVECKACLAIMAQRTKTLIHFIHRGVRWDRASSAPYKCGALGDEASNNRADVTCPECRTLMGIGTPTPRQVPPRMEDERGMVDGVFIFTDVHHGEGYTLEVVPQLSGNVELTVSKPEDGTPEDGHLFTLSHLDRANLFRALLHEFHYSTERGGPSDD